MARARSSRLAGPSILPTTAQVAFTVASERTARLTDIILVNTSALAATVFLYIGPASQDNLVGRLSVPAGGELRFRTAIVVAAGETFRHLCETANAVTGSYHGALLIA